MCKELLQFSCFGLCGTIFSWLKAQVSEVGPSSPPPCGPCPAAPLPQEPWSTSLLLAQLAPTPLISHPALSHFWLKQKDQKCRKYWRCKHVRDLYTGIITLPICSLLISWYFLKFDLLFDIYWILSWCFYRTSYDIPNISLFNDNSQPRAHNFVTKALLLLPA